MKTRNIGGATLALLALGVLSAQATLLSHESFSGYTSGTTLSDTNYHPSVAVDGYIGNWVHASTASGTGDIVVQPGGYVSGNDGYAEATSGRVARQLDAALSATSNTVGTLYLGWVFKVNGTTGVAYEMLALYDGIGNSHADEFRNFDAGATGNGGLGGNLYGFGADNGYLSLGSYLDTGWHLMVARFDLSDAAESDSVTVWLDPASEGDPSATLSGKDLTWDTLTLSDYDEFSGFWDDIKWGTTFDDVLSAIPASPPTFGAKSPVGGTINTTPTLTVEIIDGTSAIDTDSIAMYLDDALVSHGLTQSPDTTINYVSYTVPAPLALGSQHTVKVVADDTDATLAPVTNTWTFSIAGAGFGIHITDTNAPVAGADDIAQFEVPGMDWDNIGGVVSSNYDSGSNDAFTYVANDRTTQGQLFTTGSSSPSYELNSVWVRHVLNTNLTPLGNGTWASLQTGNAVTIRIVDPAQPNSAGFVVFSEALTVVSNSITAAGDLGTGKWMEYKLSVPVALDANKQYGFDLTSYGPWFELAGMGSNDWYTGGDAYTPTSKDALGLGTVHAGGDRTFMISLTPGGGPTVTPNIQSVVVSGASATLIWNSEVGVNYGVMSKTVLTGGSWTEVTNVAGEVSSTMATVPAASAQQFFKIEGN